MWLLSEDNNRLNERLLKQEQVLSNVLFMTDEAKETLLVQEESIQILNIQAGKIKGCRN